MSEQLVERLGERQAAKRALRLRLLGRIAIAVAVVAAAVYLVGFSPVLALRASDIQIAGTTPIVADEAVRTIIAHEVDEPLARIDTGDLADQVRALVGVRDVQIDRSWPNGLVVTVEPRIPVANVAADGEFALLDREAVELARTAEPTAGVPVVTVPVGAENTASSLEAVLTVMAALPAEVLASVTSASAATPEQVTFVLADGQEVIWGSAEENELKASVLATLLQIPASVYDVSSPLAPITR